MTYNPFTWQDDSTPITAARLNAIENGLAAVSVQADSAVGTANSAASGLSSVNTQITKINTHIGNDRLNVMDFGAVGDGVTDDRAAIQSAIDAAASSYISNGATEEVFIPNGVFLLGSVNFVRDTDSAVFGAASLVLKSGVRLTGVGTLKVKNNAYGTGAYFAAIRSTYSGISNASISGIGIDGNKSNNPASQQCSNIMVTVASNFTVSGINSANANGMGIQVLGPGGSGGQSNSVKIVGNRVGSASCIGIQVSLFNDLLIENNTITFSADNAIDIYGDQATGDSLGQNFIISNNYARGCLNGIFPETVAGGVISNNRIIESVSSGIHVNRIHAQPNNLLITGNAIHSQPIGVIVTGDTGGVTIRGNVINRSSTAGVQLGGDSGTNCSYVWVLDNVINNVNVNGNPLVLITGKQVSYCRVRGTITNNTDRSLDSVQYNLAASVSNTYSAANAS